MSDNRDVNVEHGKQGFQETARSEPRYVPLEPPAPPPVQTLSAAEFAETYPPAYYAGTWADAAEHEDFIAGGDHGWDMDELVDSMTESGMQDPVEVLDGEVRDGHHRVVAALACGADVKFQVW